MIKEKFHTLQQWLRQQPLVGVAFSGGVDSTVLLHNCCQALDPARVVALHVSSCLQSSRTASMTRTVVDTHFREACRYVEIVCNPLAWPEFVTAGKRRCYHCKARTFGLLQAELARIGPGLLLDGTNMDDLGQYRPGMQAAKELGVLSPFVECHICKNDIRQYAFTNGLINHDLPSNSCLATRVSPDIGIDPEDLKKIEESEDYLYSLGFVGTRVRPRRGMVIIEVQEKDIERVVQNVVRQLILQYFADNGMGRVCIGLQGR